MNIHETGNATVYGSDSPTMLFGYAMPVIYGRKSLYSMWRVERRKKGRLTKRNSAIYNYWRHAVLSPHIKFRFVSV